MPFIFLYGMWQFGVLAAALLGGGFLLGTTMPNEFVLGGWLAGAALVLFGLVAERIAQRERALSVPQQNATIDHGAKEAI